ncbi:MAG TPA: hypothetical protein VGB18_05915 [Candidatus Thermoplasmatota archaeon]
MMGLIRPGAYALVILVIVSGIGITWGAQTIAKSSGNRGDVVVDWERMQVDDADVVRVWIRNAGERELEGSPRILVLNENGGVQQSFAFGSFVIELDPGESVYVDWTLGSALHRCQYGMLDTNGAPADMRYPCPEPMDARSADDSTCYDCYRPPMTLHGRFILVGIFGENADATVLEVS